VYIMRVVHRHICFVQESFMADTIDINKEQLVGTSCSTSSMAPPFYGYTARRLRFIMTCYAHEAAGLFNLQPREKHESDAHFFWASASDLANILLEATSDSAAEASN